jgi:thiamine biosynthesis lipoprotein
MLNFFLARTLYRWLTSFDESDKSPKVEILSEAPTDLSKVIITPNNVSLCYPAARREAMACLFEIFLAGTDREALVLAAEQALDEVTRLDGRLSRFRPDSDISRLNAHASESWVRLEPGLYRLLKECVDISNSTEGAFSITLAPLIQLWGFSAAPQLPTSDDILQSLSLCDYHNLIFDDEENLVLFQQAGMEIDLGAVGKGYAIDAAKDTLRMYQVTNAVIHGGQSTIYAMGENPENGSWEFAIKNPLNTSEELMRVTLHDEALSTSSDDEQHFILNGKRYGHILDPRTGYPVDNNVLSVSVISPRAMISDALSTAFYVLDADATEEICKSLQDIRVVMVKSDRNNNINLLRFGKWPN